jgi:ATP-dependent DNA helicase RecQ
MGDVERIDATVSAQKIMSAIHRSGQKFGAVHIADIVVGAKTQKIKQLGHDQLKTYGVGKDQDKKHWRRIIDALLAQDCIVQNQEHYSALELTPKGQQILLGKQRFGIIRQKSVKKASFTGLTGNYSEKLFAQLRSERLRLAQAEGIPPFVVFSDRTLREMALYFPDTPEKMSGISGVGAAKLEKYGDTFMTLIEMYKHMHPEEAKERAILQVPIKIKKKTRKKKAAGKTVMDTLAFATQGLSIEAIAGKRGLSDGTISQHIEKLLEEGLGKDLDIDQLLEPSIRIQIEELFNQHSGKSMKALIEASGDTVTYADLRTVRAFMQVESDG